MTCVSEFPCLHFCVMLDRMRLKCSISMSDVQCSSWKSYPDYDDCAWCRISSARRWAMNSLTFTTSFLRDPRTTPQDMMSSSLMLRQRLASILPCIIPKLLEGQTCCNKPFQFLAETHHCLGKPHTPICYIDVLSSTSYFILR